MPLVTRSGCAQRVCWRRLLATEETRQEISHTFIFCIILSSFSCEELGAPFFLFRRHGCLTEMKPWGICMPLSKLAERPCVIHQHGTEQTSGKRISCEGGICRRRSPSSFPCHNKSMDPLFRKLELAVSVRNIQGHLR